MLGYFRVSPLSIRAMGAMCAEAEIIQITRHVFQDFFWKKVEGYNNNK
jgi:hypothetical protein